MPTIKNKIQATVKARMIESFAYSADLDGVTLMFGNRLSKGKVVCFVNGPNPARVEFEVGRKYTLPEIWFLLNDQQGGK